MILLRSPSYGTTKRNINLVYFLKPTDEMKYPNGGMNLYENLQFLFFYFLDFLFCFFPLLSRYGNLLFGDFPYYIFQGVFIVGRLTPQLRVLVAPSENPR